MAQKEAVRQLFELVEDIEIAMFTTRRRDGRLVSRPMATQARSEGADFWFVTDRETHKLEELDANPFVNLAYYDTKSREYVSVSGVARVVEDRDKIRELYRPDWKAWFPGEGPEAGTPEDPRIALIAVDAETVSFLEVDKPRPVVFFEVVKGMVTGARPDVGEVRRLSARDLKHAKG